MSTTNPTDVAADTIDWHGTDAELARLQGALARHCTCQHRPAPFGTIVELCSAHAMLRDQRLLDRLVFVYRARAQFARGEWRVRDGAG
jgi:hypothetical protein